MKIAIICAGTILTISVVVSAMIKITNLIKRKCTIRKDYHDNNEHATIYSEINGDSVQMSSPIEGLSTTVLTRSCACLDNEDTRPELPVRNRGDKERLPINTAKDDIAQEWAYSEISCKKIQWINKMVSTIIYLSFKAFDVERRMN